MSRLSSIVASHPLRRKPYASIRFTRINGNGTPLYRVGADKEEVGAAEALKRSFERHGGHCFHCETWLPPQKLSQRCNRDHVRPKQRGGRTVLHNLVITCGGCNRKKGARDIITFRLERGLAFLEALDSHLVRCLDALAKG